MDKKVKGVFQNQPKREPAKGMKRIWILAIVAIISTLGHGIISFIALFLFLSLMGFAVLPAGLILIGWIAFILFGRKQLGQKFGIKTPEYFIVIGGVPTLSSGIYYITIQKMQEAGYWEGQMFGGMFEGLFALTLVICAFFTVITLVFVSIIEFIQKQRKNKL